MIEHSSIPRGLDSDATESIALDNLTLVEKYISARKAERGLTPSGERWVRTTLPRFAVVMGKKGIPLPAVTRDDIRSFLSGINGVWHRHSHFRGLRALYNWAEREGLVGLSPCHGMQAPKLPYKVMPRPTLPEVRTLVDTAGSARNKAIICLFADTGFRLVELSNIKPEDIDWQKQTVKVWGKGAKQRVGRFGDVTASYLRQHLESYAPNGNIWGINERGIAMMLKRLRLRTGVTCNPHSFRRTFACLLRKAGVDTMTIKDLGRWESLEMVQRYTRSVTFEDSMKHYRAPLG